MPRIIENTPELGPCGCPSTAHYWFVLLTNERRRTTLLSDEQAQRKTKHRVSCASRNRCWSGGCASPESVAGGWDCCIPRRRRESGNSTRGVLRSRNH